jgi:protein regulator of cytokinesis 1
MLSYHHLEFHLHFSQHSLPEVVLQHSMDLNVLFASQIDKLKNYYQELGHAPDRLQSALQAAIDNEVERSVQEIKDAKDQISALRQQCEAYSSVLDESISSTSSSSSNLFSNIKDLQLERDRLLSIYASRKSQAEKLVIRIEEYRPILGEQVPVVDLGSSGPDSSVVLPLPRPSELHAILSSCAEEVSKRNTQLEENLSSIAELWSDLWQLPDSKDDFDSMIMQHLNIRPLLADVGQGSLEFAGLFEEIEEQESVMDATPSRKSGLERELGTQVARVQRKKAMSPTLENLAKASAKVQELDAERERRHVLIQRLFDELSLLWRRFDVGDDAVDDFVQENTGCNIAVIQAYERELKQMRELKQEHMTMFISKVREDIASLWDQLLMTEDERRESLPEFFQDLMDGEEGGVDPSDELLALHEQKVKELTDELAVKARPLELVRQYKKLMEESLELEASAKDTSRLTGRGTGQKRDPGRLLREEKMRKRIKVMKPKIESELLKTIPAWEEESGRPFCMNGVRFLDTVGMQPASPKKRIRTMSSNASIAATPQQPLTKRSRAESAQVTSSVRRVMPTPHSFSTPGTRQAPPSVKTSHIPLPKAGPQGQSMRAPLSVIRNGTQEAPKSQSPAKDRMASHASTSSITSVGTTIIHKPFTKLKRRGPSLLIEQSIRNSGMTKNDYAKPCSTGVGATVRPIGLYTQSKVAAAIEESVDGPNWAVFDENDESNLLS